jgi:hypothetical protein
VSCGLETVLCPWRLPKMNIGHIPSGSRHWVWTGRGKRRLNRFPRTTNKIESNGLTGNDRPRANGSSLYRHSRLRRPATAPRRQRASPQAGKVRA